MRARVYAPSARARARIFTKKFLVVSNYLMNLSLKFHKDPCIDTRARVVNIRTLNHECARLQLMRAHMHGSFLVVSNHLMSLNLKFRKDLCFC